MPRDGLGTYFDDFRATNNIKIRRFATAGFGREVGNLMPPDQRNRRRFQLQIAPGGA